MVERICILFRLNTDSGEALEIDDEAILHIPLEHPLIGLVDDRPDLFVDGLRDLDDAVVVEVQAGNRVVALRNLGLLLDGDGLEVVVEFDDAVRLRGLR